MLQTGMRLAVPLGAKGLRCAVLLDFISNSDIPEGIEIKELCWPLEKEPLLDAEYLVMLKQLALRQMVSSGRILGSVLPFGLKSVTGAIRRFGEGRPESYKLTAIRNKDEAWLKELASDWIAGSASFMRSEANLLEIEYCTVCKDPPWAVRPTAKKQIELLEYLWEHGGKSRRQLTDVFGTGISPVINTLVGHELLKIGPRPADCVQIEDNIEQAESDEESRLERLAEELAALHLTKESTNKESEPEYVFDLTPEQYAAVEGLNSQMQLDKMQAALVYGVTGSGKTAVYIELAKSCIASGRSVLLLAPEVALACKLYRETKKHLPDFSVYLAHGYQSSIKREKLFRQLAQSDEPVIITGTRSSLFLPLTNIGLIVLDEEHDASFKQDEGLVYQAKDLAYFRAVQHKALIVLGSATPDVRSFYAATAGGNNLNEFKMPVYFLKNRLGSARLPELDFVDIRAQKQSDSILARESIKALCKTVEAGQQAIVLLNRRGYSPLMYCLDCGQVIKCPNCDVGMTFHKARNRTVCHYCGHSTPFPVGCGRCNSLHYLPMGEGTEKLEESLLPHLPLGTKILRLDRDTTRRPGRMEEILAAFARQEAQILVGTQMLSKGHHFPEVTLAIVADADLGLNLPDYQAAERTFQLILQSAGRSGRGETPGKVIVQTRDPNHFCWSYVQSGDYEGFYTKEIALRELRRYPPFVKLGLIRFSFPMQWEDGMEIVRKAGQAAKSAAKDLDVMVLGPAPAPMPLLRGQRRFQCLLKGSNWMHIRSVFASVLGSVSGQSKLKISLDIDPGSMM